MNKTVKNRNRKRRSVRCQKNGVRKNTKKQQGGDMFQNVKNMLYTSNSPHTISVSKQFFKSIDSEKDYDDANFRDITPTNIAFYQIYGLGCDFVIERNLEQAQKYNDSYLKQFQSGIAHTIKSNDEDVHIICNHKLDPIYNIIALWTGRKLSADSFLSELSNLENTKEFTSLLENVKRDLGLGKNVYVNAHSFGGAMSNQLAIALQKIANQDSSFMQKMKTNLTIRTFGSIFIAPLASVKDVNITNYLALDDVAQKLNGRIEPNPNDFVATFPISYSPQYKGAKTFVKITGKSNHDSVVWIDHYLDDKYSARLITGASPSQTKQGLFGNTYQWKIHNLYSALDTTLQKTIQVKRYNV